MAASLMAGRGQLSQGSSGLIQRPSRRATAASTPNIAIVRDSSNGSGKSGPGSNALSRLCLSVSSAIHTDLRNSHRGTQALQGSIDPRFDSRDRQVECRSHIAQRHIKVKVQKNRHALVVGQAHQRPTKVLSLDPSRLIDGLHGRCIRDPNHMPPSTPAGLSALVGDDAHKPRLEWASFPKVLEVPPGS